MERVKASPYDIRLAQDGLLSYLKSDDPRPTVVIDMLEDQSEDLKKAMRETYERFADPEFKKRVTKVKQAIDILEQLD